MQVEASGRGRVGERRAVMQQYDQRGALAAVEGRRPGPDEAAGLGEERVGETGARERGEVQAPNSSGGIRPVVQR